MLSAAARYHEIHVFKERHMPRSTPGREGASMPRLQIRSFSQQSPMSRSCGRHAALLRRLRRRRAGRRLLLARLVCLMRSTCPCPRYVASRAVVALRFAGVHRQPPTPSCVKRGSSAEAFTAAVMRRVKIHAVLPRNALTIEARAGYGISLPRSRRAPGRCQPPTTTIQS